MKENKLLKTHDEMKQLHHQKIDFNSIFLHFTGYMYGVGCSALNLKKIHEISIKKNRDNDKGYIVLIPSLDSLSHLTENIPIKIKYLLEQYWPGNLTIVLPTNIPELKKLGINNKVAFRVPVSRNLRDFLEIFDQPMVSTSINVSGQPFETNLDIIRDKYRNWFDFELDSSHEKKREFSASTLITFENDQINVIREGTIKKEELDLSYKSPLITFTCTGNICRSPIAEYLMRKKIKENNLPFRTMSAGELQSGNSISENSRIVLEQAGINASSHSSTQINEDIIRKSWRIITMAKHHKDSIIKLFPNCENKVFTLGEICGLDDDVADPYMMDLSVYQKTYDIIKQRIVFWLDSLK